MIYNPSNDNRGKQLVYVSSCLLDQNRRFPGIAVQKGAIGELLTPLFERGIGIEQLPCLECLGWGGVSRQTLFRFLPMLYNHVNSRFYPFLKGFAKIWLYKYRRLCQKEAKKVADQIKDFQETGYNVLAIIAMNDSPTCGATKTIHLLESIGKYKALGLSLEDMLHPRLDQMQVVMPQVIEEGSGIFMISLRTALKKEKVNVPIIGFDPWKDSKAEIQRILSAMQEPNGD